MKRLSAMILMLCLLLSGCGKKQEPGVTYPDPEPEKPWSIGKGQLTDQQLALMPPEAEGSSAVFSFSAPDQAGAAKLILFRLENGTWEDIAGGNWSELAPDSWDGLGAASGTIALSFRYLWEDCVYHSFLARETAQGQMLPHAKPEGDPAQLNTAVTFLSARTEADWEELVPIAVQAAGHQDRIYAPGLDIFENPEAYENQGYEQVYLLAFSLKKAEDSSKVETFAP